MINDRQKHLQPYAHTYKGPLTVPRSTYAQRQTQQHTFSAGASAQPPLLCDPATAMAIATIFQLQRREFRRAIQRMTRRSCQLDLERQRSQRRQHPTPTCPRTWCRVRPALPLVDSPTRQRRAAHALAAEAAMASSRRRGPIKRREKGATSASCHSLILEIGSSSAPWWLRYSRTRRSPTVPPAYRPQVNRNRLR